MRGRSHWNGGRAVWAWAFECPHRVFAKGKSIAHYASLRETWATVPLDRRKQKRKPGAFPRQHIGKKQHEYHHSPGQGNQIGVRQA